MAEGMCEETMADSVETADMEMDTPAWAKLPQELQNKVLSYLPLRKLFQLRCVCREWRQVIHHRGFRSMFDGINSTMCSSPSICYVGSYYPRSLEWSTYDFDEKVWKKMKTFPPHVRVEQESVYQGLYSAGGLLFLLLWKQKRNVRTHHPFLVWNPLTNKSKNLPPCKYKNVTRGTFFVHAFADDTSKTYKILSCHNPKSHPYQYMENDTMLLTEIYDSATDSWRECSKYTLKLSLSPSWSQTPRRGVLCNGVVYFVARSSTDNLLLSYDIETDQWKEDVTDEECMEIFEWDGRVMTAMPLLSVDEVLLDDNGYQISIFELNIASKKWVDVGIEIPSKIRNKFVEDDEGVEIAASGNNLVITGYMKDGSFRVAVYKKAENYWRFPPTGAFSDRLRQARIEGLFQFKPKLDWIL